FYRIASLPALTADKAAAGAVGYVGKDDVFPWATREGLNFMPLLAACGHPEIVAWGNYDKLRRFVETGDMKEGTPPNREDLQRKRKRERAALPYPVLGGWTEKLRGTVERRAFSVLLPGATQPDAKVVITPDAAKGDTKDSITQTLDRTMTRTTVVIAFDATADN